MQLVEQHVIDRRDRRFVSIDAAAFLAKNLYNAALYLVRQSFIFEHRYLGYKDVYQQMKGHDAYRALPTKVAQQVLRLLDKNWQSYFAACEAYREDPSKFKQHPKLPHYKHKTDGRYVLVYTLQALSRPGLKRGLIQPSMMPITVQTKQTRIAQVRSVPRIGYYVVEVVYERAQAAPSGTPARYAAIDIGVDNLAALTSNQKGFVPRLVNGRPIKSINQFYNKRRAELQAVLGHPGSTKRLEKLTTKRTRRINQYLHEASKAVIALVVAEGIGTLVVGKNPGWKQEVELGRVNNQHFVQIPHARFIGLLEYKAKLAGIRFVLQEESYTSKASFLDGDPIPTYDPKQEDKHVFSGKREKRGLYRAKDGRTLNADVNGSYNILRKALASRLWQGDRGARSCTRLVDVRSVSPTSCVGGDVNQTNQSIVRYCAETMQ
jgi:putative transposase